MLSIFFSYQETIPIGDTLPLFLSPILHLLSQLHYCQTPIFPKYKVTKLNRFYIPWGCFWKLRLRSVVSLLNAGIGKGGLSFLAHGLERKWEIWQNIMAEKKLLEHVHAVIRHRWAYDKSMVLNIPLHHSNSFHIVWWEENFCKEKCWETNFNKMFLDRLSLL